LGIVCDGVVQLQQMNSFLYDKKCYDIVVNEKMTIMNITLLKLGSVKERY